MRPVSTAFAAAVGESHTIATEITVLRESDEIETITTAIDGTVTLDGTAATRGRLDLTIADDAAATLIPALAADALAPYGNEIQVKRGIAYLVGGEETEGPGYTSFPGGYPDTPSLGATELISLGIFRIDDITIDDTGSGIQLRVAGQDRSARIIDARFEDPYQVADATNYADAILDVIQDAWPDVEYDLAATSRTTPALIAAEGDDRWKFAQDMATSIGMSLYFDGDGILVLRPVSTAATTPVVSVTEGEGGVLLALSKRWTRQGAFNRVIATGENTGLAAPARGVATDDNPLSPTYYYGPFGRVPRFYTSPFITTDDQAADAAAGILARELGTTQQLNLGAIVNPAYEPDDVITVTRQALGVDEAHIIDQITIPLAATGQLGCVTRATQVTG